MMKNQISSEIHLFILWENARYKEWQIIEDIKNNFKILGLYEINWSKEKFSENLSRFYGRKLPVGSNKEKHCGVGPFLLIVVEDYSPKYMQRKTSKGVEIVNIKTFDSKSKYREWTGGGHKIHCTNSKKETDHDLTLLLGVNSCDYKKSKKDFSSKEVIKLNSDIVGSKGWKNIRELFYVLNNTIEYVVLRNFECLPDQYNMENHGDIDILSNNLIDMIWIMNGEKVFRPKYRVQYKVNIGGEVVLFDCRYVGDNYYDINWEKNILNNRVIVEDTFYAPNTYEYYYSLLYHAIIHKRKVPSDYIFQLWKMCEKVGINELDIKDFSEIKNMKNQLELFMESKGYNYTEPIDLSVFFNKNIIGTKISLNRWINENIFKRINSLINKV
ncbi:hypothetical protein [Clostridium sp. KNHs214]|uniref:hypothetical protein n=1 Tax=Clostridium sp. KNHs214 TaxID=1540257 RepID=UPI00054E4BA1|nr:hypothetical protein [Clostridium sp. KNHs214]